LIVGLLAANTANWSVQKKRTTYQSQPLPLSTQDKGELEAKMAELERMYHLR